MKKKIFLNPAELDDLLIKSGFASPVFTNGVFDILHPGHVELLDFARSKGDCLVVGINSDESVKRLKGDSRPVFPLPERMELLAALRMVDYVIPFSEDTPLELIKALQSVKVLIKGGDYSADAVVGRREIESRGGTLFLFPISTRVSTSGIISLVNNRGNSRR